MPRPERCAGARSLVSAKSRLRNSFAAVREGRSIDVNNPLYKRPTQVFFVSRIGGEDGVSLEIMHWARAYQRQGGRVLILAGERSASEELLNLEKLPGIRVKELPHASPSHPDAQAEYEALFGPTDYFERTGRRYWSDHTQADATAALEFVEIRARLIKTDLERELRSIEGNWILDWENLGLGWKQNAPAMAAADITREMRPPIAGRIHDLPDDRPQYDWGNVPQVIKDRINVIQQFPNTSWGVINSLDQARLARRGIKDSHIFPNANDLADPRLSVRPPAAELRMWREALLGTQDAKDTPETFQFTDSQRLGLSVFEQPALAALERELSAAADATADVLATRRVPGGPLSGPYAAMAANNYKYLESTTDYPVITRQIVEMMWRSASASAGK